MGAGLWRRVALTGALVPGGCNGTDSARVAQHNQENPENVRLPDDAVVTHHTSSRSKSSESEGNAGYVRSDQEVIQFTSALDTSAVVAKIGAECEHLGYQIGPAIDIRIPTADDRLLGCSRITRYGDVLTLDSRCESAGCVYVVTRVERSGGL